MKASLPGLVLFFLLIGCSEEEGFLSSSEKK